MKNTFQGRRIFKKSRGVNRDATIHGFTLVEMLVATGVMVLILTMTLQITNYANNLWMSTRKRIDTFQEARAGFESMTRKISQAMLNTYWDYADASGNPRTVGSGSNAVTSGSFTPTQYLRQSELHFVCGQAMSGSSAPIFDSAGQTTLAATGVQVLGHAIFFQAPVGYSTTTTSAVLPNLLNADGYFLEFASDNPERPKFLQSGTTPGSYPLPLRYRFRLKELSLPSENLGVYKYTQDSGPPMLNYWFNYPLLNNTDPNTGAALTFSPRSTLSQNIIALVIQPMRSANYPAPTGAPVELAPNYLYDSRAWAAPTKATDQWSSTSRNQLPPQLQVSMVAIDEASAARLQLLSGSSIPTFSDNGYTGSDGQALPGGLYTSSGVCNLFQVATKPSSSAGTYDQYTQDMSNLQKALIHLHINYRIFSTNVTILQAKFSDN